jgi:hypothetical protein
MCITTILTKEQENKSKYRRRPTRLHSVSTAPEAPLQLHCRQWAHRMRCPDVSRGCQCSAPCPHDCVCYHIITPLAKCLASHTVITKKGKSKENTRKERSTKSPAPEAPLQLDCRQWAHCMRCPYVCWGGLADANVPHLHTQRTIVTS